MDSDLKKHDGVNACPRVCITYTTLSDNTQIIDNIIWHHSQKAAFFIVYLEKNIDEFKSKLSFIENLIVLQSANYIVSESDPKWVKEAQNRIKEGYDFEKVLNVYQACKIAYDDLKCDWLVSIDADELVYTPTEKSEHALGQSLSLQDFFASVPKHITQVRFKAAELVPSCDVHKCSIFAGNNSFVTFPSDFTMFFGRVLNRILLACRVSSNFVEPILSLFYYINGYSIRNKFSDILRGRGCKPYYLGYMGYKSAIRLPNHRNNLFSIHYWLNKWPKKSPRTIDVGYLLHFDLPNFAEYRNKSKYQIANPPRYKNRRELFEIGRSVDEDTALTYFKKNILVPMEKIQKCKTAVSICIDTQIFKRLS